LLQLPGIITFQWLLLINTEKLKVKGQSRLVNIGHVGHVWVLVSVVCN